MKGINYMTQAELAAYVQSHLREKGIIVILSGGAVVGIYSKGQYVSKDIDLVNAQFASDERIEQAMQELGFQRVGKHGRHFEHPESEQVVEFPPGPLTLGDAKVEELNEIQFITGRLSTLTPTDCVKDRLAHFYYWKDLQCLKQAIMVAREHSVDLESIKEWSKKEGMESKYKEFFERLSESA